MIRIAEVERLNDVRPTAFDVHHRLAADVLDHQWLPLMTPQGAARLRPYSLQVVDVVSVDIFQCAVAGQIQVASWCAPLIGVIESLELFGIRSEERRVGKECRYREGG